jgi:uncharacterized protein
VIAAPIAAWLVRHIPPRVLGSAVGGIIILTNVRTLLKSDWVDASDAVRWPVYAVIYVVWAAALVYSIRQYRANREEERRIVAETSERSETSEPSETKSGESETAAT